MKKPINTEVIYNGSEIYIERETEKAYFMFFENLNFGKLNPMKPHTEFWCPKSTWENQDNFIKEDVAGKLTGNLIFKFPNWIKTN